MIVTALEPDPRRPGSVRVLVDGRAFATVDTAAASGLAPGGALADATAERLARAADAEAAYRTVLRALERRPLARADLGRRLLRRGLAAEAVENALARAERAGLLDDAAFARHYVATRTERGRGPARLARDLLALGVARPIVDAAITEHGRRRPTAARSRRRSPPSAPRSSATCRGPPSAAGSWRSSPGGASQEARRSRRSRARSGS